MGCPGDPVEVGPIALAPQQSVAEPESEQGLRQVHARHRSDLERSSFCCSVAPLNTGLLTFARCSRCVCVCFKQRVCCKQRVCSKQRVCTKQRVRPRPSAFARAEPRETRDIAEGGHTYPLTLGGGAAVAQ